MRIALSFRRSLLRVSPLLVVACARSGPTPPARFELLRCPSLSAAGAESVVDGAGDVISVRGHSFALPQGAVRRPVRFNVQDRRTGQAGVDIRPQGTRFERPVRLTLSYARCADEAERFRDLRIVEVRHGSTEIVGDPLESEVSREARTVSADIRHLTGYLIGGTRAQ